MTRRIALALFLLFTVACASTPEDKASQEMAKQQLSGGVAEFQVTFYDGGVLRGRVLLGATVDTLVIDGRLYEGIDVEIEKVRACGKTEPLTYSRLELLRPPPRSDEIVTLHRGYWYGEDVFFPLFHTKAGPGPDCFEAEIVVRARGLRVAARQPIRVVRTDKPSAPPDVKMEEPKPPASDAGAP